MESPAVSPRPRRQKADLPGSLVKWNFDEQVNRMGELNPAYKGVLTGAKISSELRRELQDVFIGKEKDENGRPLPLSRRTIMARLEVMITSFMTRIEQIEGLQSPANSKTEFSREESAAAVRTFLKTAQEILSHSDDRRAFDRGEGSVDDIVVDPRLITDTLLTNLGLTDAVPAKGTKEPEKVAQRAKAIPDIKAMLGHLEPIKLPGQKDTELKYFRLMRMAKGENEGMILGTQVINGQKVLFKTDLYGAGRRIAHIENGYLEETDLLRKIDGVVTNALAHLDEWSKISDDDLAAIRTGMLECVDNLENVENKDKVALREQLQASFTFRDSLGRYNPNVMQARLLKAKRHLGSRLEEIEDISRYLTVDKLKMRGLVKEQVDPIEGFLNKVTQAPHWKKTDMLREIGDLKKVSARQKYEPYLSFGRKFSEKLEKAEADLQSDNLEAAAQEFTEVYLIAKLERAYKEIQAVYSKISLHPEESDPGALLIELQIIHDRLKTHNFAPNRDTSEYTPAFIEVYHLLNSLKKRLRETMAPIQQNLNLGESQSPQPESQKQIKKSRMDEVLERVEKIPAVGKVISEIRGILASVLNKFKEPKVSKKSAQPSAEALVDKNESFTAMKKRVKEFDFRALAQELPV